MQQPLLQPLSGHVYNAPSGTDGENQPSLLTKLQAMLNDLYGAPGAVGGPGSNLLFQFGANTAFALGGPMSGFNAQGNLYRNIANPIAGNLADTTDDVLGGFQLPALVFDLPGRGINLTFAGKLGATANNKRIKIWANPTLAGATVNPATGVISGGSVTGAGAGILLLDSLVQTGNAVGWELLGSLFKFGVNGSNTQFFQGSPIFGATHGGVSVPAFPVLPENAAINIVITGSSPTTGAANDVVLSFIEANVMN